MSFPCAVGPGTVTYGDGSTGYIGSPAGSGIGPVQKAIATTICPTPAGGTSIGSVLPAGSGNCTGLTFATCAANFQTAFQATYTAGGANANYIPTALANGSQIQTGLLDPNYKSPRSVQFNIGVQRELRPGMVLTVDYLRNVGLHYLIGQDINHTGDISTFSKSAASSIIDTVNSTFGCPAGSVGVNCAIAAGATMSNYASGGLDSPYDLGIGSCQVGLGNACAFPGNNPNVGNFYMYRPGGRSVYNGMDISGSTTSTIRSAG